MRREKRLKKGGGRKTTYKIGRRDTFDCLIKKWRTKVEVPISFSNDRSVRRKRKTKMAIQIPFSAVRKKGKRKWKFEFRSPMLQKNGISNFVFQFHRKTEKENGNSNSVFQCHRKLVGTRVHAFCSSPLFL